MKKIWNEFKTFALKGSVLDLAIGVVIGAAFSKIISALVDNILTPILGMIIGGKNFETLVLRVGESELQYGLFISAIIDFLIVALVLFIFVKAINKLIRKEPPQPAPAPAEKSPELKVLEEIRDSLKKQNSQ